MRSQSKDIPWDDPRLKEPVRKLGVDRLRCKKKIFDMWKAYNVKTVGDLVQLKEADIRKTRQFGDTCMCELKRGLYGMGLRLDMRLVEPKQSKENLSTNSLKSKSLITS